MPELTFPMSPRQLMGLQTLAKPEVRELLYGGAKGGGKSVFGCRWSVIRSAEIMQQCKIQPSANPPVIGFLGRKQSVDFTNTTLETWKRFVPPELYRIQKVEKLIVIQESVSLRYGGLDDTETIKKFNSAEYAFFFLDQAEECTESDIGMLRGTFRLKLNGVQPAYKALYTANPKPCYLRKAFVIKQEPGHAFVKALPSDNPFIDNKAYIEQLKLAYGYNPSLLKALLEGSWSDLDQAYVVIPLGELEKNVANPMATYKRVKRVTVADIADSGDDETVIYDMTNTRIDNSEVYTHVGLMDTVGRIIAHQKRHKSNMVCVDIVGLGAGVYSRLQEIYGDDKRVTVYGYDGRCKAPGKLNDLTFANYRAYAYFKVRELTKTRQLDLKYEETLFNQLSGVTYHFTSGGEIIIDKKEDLKETLGCSPDRADTYVMGIDAMEKAAFVEVNDAWAPKKTREFKPALV